MSSARRIEARGDIITQAARVLIGVARMSEKPQGRRVRKTELVLDVELTAGGTEQWLITIERTASNH